MRACVSLLRGIPVHCGKASHPKRLPRMFFFSLSDAADRRSNQTNALGVQTEGSGSFVCTENASRRHRRRFRNFFSLSFFFLLLFRLPNPPSVVSHRGSAMSQISPIFQ